MVNDGKLEIDEHLLKKNLCKSLCNDAILRVQIVCKTNIGKAKDAVYDYGEMDEDWEQRVA